MKSFFLTSASIVFILSGFCNVDGLAAEKPKNSTRHSSFPQRLHLVNFNINPSNDHGGLLGLDPALQGTREGEDIMMRKHVLHSILTVVHEKAERFSAIDLDRFVTTRSEAESLTQSFTDVLSMKKSSFDTNGHFLKPQMMTAFEPLHLRLFPETQIEAFEAFEEFYLRLFPETHTGVLPAGAHARVNPAHYATILSKHVLNHPHLDTAVTNPGGSIPAKPWVEIQTILEHKLGKTVDHDKTYCYFLAYSLVTFAAPCGGLTARDMLALDKLIGVIKHPRPKGITSLQPAPVVVLLEKEETEEVSAPKMDKLVVTLPRHHVMW